MKHKCFICDNEPAAVMVFCPKGCTCSDSKFQPRCFHHLTRLDDSCDDYWVIEVYKDAPFSDAVVNVKGFEVIT